MSPSSHIFTSLHPYTVGAFLLNMNVTRTQPHQSPPSSSISVHLSTKWPWRFTVIHPPPHHPLPFSPTSSESAAAYRETFLRTPVIQVTGWKQNQYQSQILRERERERGRQTTCSHCRFCFLRFTTCSGERSTSSTTGKTHAAEACPEKTQPQVPSYGHTQD